MKSTKFLLLINFIIIFPALLIGQNNQSVIFNADETDSIIQAEFRFLSQPDYGKEAILQIKLRAISDELNKRALRMKPANVNIPNLKKIGQRTDVLKPSNAIEWSITAGPKVFITLPDTIIVWNTPIETGDSLVYEIPCLINGVGEFNFILSEIGDTKDQIKTQMVVVLDAEGKTIYTGKYPPPHSNPLKAHVYCFGENIETFLEGKEILWKEYSRGVQEPFDIRMLIEPTLKVGHTSEVKLAIKAMSAKIDDIQYEIVQARKLQIDTIPTSQGENPGNDIPFEASFNITPLAPGRAYLSFEVFGLYEDIRHGDLVRSKISYNLIFGNDSTLLYMGEVEPFEAGFEAGNPAYQRIDGIIEFKDAKIGYKTQRSQPDFQYDRKNEERISDSLQKIEDDKKK